MKKKIEIEATFCDCCQAAQTSQTCEYCGKYICSNCGHIKPTAREHNDRTFYLCDTCINGKLKQLVSDLDEAKKQAVEWNSKYITLSKSLGQEIAWHNY